MTSMPRLIASGFLLLCPYCSRNVSTLSRRASVVATRSAFETDTVHSSSSSIAESLILEIITDGSIQPIEAIYSASSILENIFASFQVKDETIPTPPMVLEATETTNEYDNIIFLVF